MRPLCAFDEGPSVHRRPSSRRNADDWRLTSFADVGQSRKREGKLVRSIGERIRDERVMWGMTQEELAEATGIDRDKISKIETGDRQVRVEELGKLAETFEIPADELMQDREAFVYQRVDLSRPETRKAQRWLEQCVDNSLFIRRIGTIYER